jgi:outer membrane protein TolC
MLGFCTAKRRLASLLGGLCVGGALALPALVQAGELAAPPINVARPADNNADKDEDNDKKDAKNDKAGSKDEKRGLGTAVPPHLAGVPVLDLASCKTIALTKQPAIAAALASYQAAQARQNALDTVRVPNFLARDLPLRKTQSAVGVKIAHLDVQRVQLDTVYSVHFSYLSAQYAAEQHLLLDNSRERLLRLQDGVRAGLKAGKTNIRKEDEARVEYALNVLDARLEEARMGEQRALSALREALGVDPCSPLIVRATGLYRLKPDLDKDRAVADALARRPEIQQATLLVQVHGIEVDAQAMKRLFPTSPTFASGSDIHSRPLPAGSYDEQYRPAAVGPEMPVTINGCDSARAEVAKTYHERSGSVLEKTKNLIALETEQAYLRYLESCRKLPRLIEAARNAQAVFDATDAAFQKGERATTVRDWLNAGGTVTELRSQVNTARYQLLVALAGLERATACGFQAGFELAPTTDPPEPDQTKKDKEEDKDKDDKNGGNGKNEKLDAPKKDNGGKKGADKDNEPTTWRGPRW